MSRRSLGVWSPDNEGQAMFAARPATGCAPKRYRKDRKPVPVYAQRVDHQSVRHLRMVPKCGWLARIYAANRASSEARKARGR